MNLMSQLSFFGKEQEENQRRKEIMRSLGAFWSIVLLSQVSSAHVRM